MLKFTPIFLAILYALAMYRFSVWRTHRELDARQRGVYTRPKHGQPHETAAGEIDDRTLHTQGVQDQERGEPM